MGAGATSIRGWEYSSVVECVLSMHKAHGSIPSITLKKTHKKEQSVLCAIKFFFFFFFKK